MTADCLAVFTDSEDSPCGPEDLAAVSRSVSVPILSRDWMLHPVQLAEAAAGGAAALTLINCVIGKGLGSMLAFADAAGLDAPVEVRDTPSEKTLSETPAPAPPQLQP